jgi:hypothetical protein
MHQSVTLLATVAAALGAVSVSQAQTPVQNVDLISNWQAPLYWQPPVRNSEGAIHRGRIRESAVEPMAAAGSNLGLPAVFVAMTPCRIVETRVASYAPNYGPPAYQAGETRQYALPASPKCLGIPANAVAFSINVAVVPNPLGTPIRWLTIWDTGSPQPQATTLNDYSGIITSNSAVVPAGAGGSISVFVKDGPTDVLIDINGYYLPSADLARNTELGLNALAINAGTNNTAVGSDALVANTTGTTNTAVGSETMIQNTTGQGNTAIGVGTLAANTTGGQNTAIGNTALAHNTTGSANTAIGNGALAGLTSGDNNFAIGFHAGQLATGGTFNLFIANQGQAGDTNLTRIGDANQHEIFISGIHGVTTGGAAVPVLVDANGQLGTASSSRSTKQDIEDMGDTTGTIMSLHPVRFHYKAWGPDSEMQYGLIAEDVADVAPDLVARTPKGEIMTVYYDKVNAMVLNQVQEQHRLIEKQNTLIQQLESRIAELENRDH